MGFNSKVWDAIEEADELLETNTVDIGDVRIAPDATTLYSYAEEHYGFVKIRISPKAWLEEYFVSDRILHIVLHEYGHAWLFQYWQDMSSKDQKKFQRLFGDINEEADYNRMDWCNTTFVTRYAQLSSHEDWAETFVTLFLETKYRSKEAKAKARFAWDLLTRYSELEQAA